MSYTLYSPKHQATAGQKVELFARFIDLPITLQRIGFDKIKSPEYLAKHPLGKVPSLQTPEGTIYESNTILRYLALKVGKFYGKTPAETATVDQWLEFINTQLAPGNWRTVYPILGFNTVTKEQYEAGKKDYLETLRILQAQLSKTHYLAGNEITIADIASIQYVRLALRLFLVEKSRATIPHVVQWYERLFTHKEIAEEFGKPWLCTLEVVPHFEVAEKKEQKKKEQKKEQKKATEPKKEQKKKQQAPKKKEQPKKKQDKKKKQKSDAEDEEPAEKKKANPLDLLPKSPFNLDDWKREFCNAPDKAATLNELWPKFDHQGWSLWKVHYIKYEGEGVVGYLTSNLKNGHIRNLDQHFRKYSFAVYGVYGEEGNYEIDGIFMWRGTEIPEAWKEHNSYEYFTFTKLDENDPAVQKETAEYWLNLNETDTVLGRKVFDAKMYK